MRTTSQRCYQIGEFRLYAEEKILLRGNTVVDVTPKAVDVLSVLVENAGHLVSKDEILRKVWPDSFVEEANLTHHIFRLRKALGENDDQKFIETIPKRGYRFVAAVREVDGFADAEALQNQPAPELAAPSQRPRDRTLWVLAAVLLLGGIAGGFAWYRYGRENGGTRAVESRPVSGNDLSIVRLTNSGKFVAATISPDGKFVAYAQNHASGEGMLYIRQLETNTERKLLEPAERNFGTIAFSPDGSFLYYIAYEPGDPEGAIYRIPVIGGSYAKIVRGVKNMFSLSPDGKRAAFYRSRPDLRQTSIVQAALDGSGEEGTVLTFSDTEKTATSVPAYSPDGRLITYALSDVPTGSETNPAQSSLFAVDLESRESVSLTDEKWADIGKMLWMPDGSGIVFVAWLPRLGNQIYFLSYPAGEARRITRELNSYSNYGLGITRDGGILVADLWESAAQVWMISSSGDTSQARQLTSGNGDGSRALAALQDGSIVYSTRAGGENDLWLLRPEKDPADAKPLTADLFAEGDVCAAPNDDYLIFASNRAGTSQLFRIKTDGSDLRQLTARETASDAPACSQVGKIVLFVSDSSVWSVSTDGGEPTRLTDYECVAPSISPDGKYFSCIVPSPVQIENAKLAVVRIEGGAPVKTFDVIPFGWYYRPARWTADGLALVFAKNVKQIGNLWRQDIAGGPPKQISDFKSEVVFNHVFTSDGKQILVSRGNVAVNTVLFRNFRP